MDELAPAAAARPQIMDLQSAVGLSTGADPGPAAARRLTGDEESTGGAAGRKLDHQGNGCLGLFMDANNEVDACSL